MWQMPNEKMRKKISLTKQKITEKASLTKQAGVDKFMRVLFCKKNHMIPPSIKSFFLSFFLFLSFDDVSRRSEKRPTNNGSVSHGLVQSCDEWPVFQCPS
jgi:hypothetical protein